MGVFQSVAEYLFPPVCMCCGENITKEEAWLCPDCRRELELIYAPQDFFCSGGNGYADSMFTLFPYRNPRIRSFLIDYKKFAYKGNEAVYEEYARRALKQMKFLPKADLVCFAPRSVLNCRRYYIDQSEEMAETFSRISGVPFEDLLYRRGLSLSQHRLKGKNRRRNVRGKFGARRRLSGEDVILIDDIVTTGSSVSEAARVLKAAGAMHVWVFCFAH